MDTAVMSRFFALLTVAANAAVVALVAGAVAALLSSRARVPWRYARRFLGEHGLGFVWLLALVSTLGSLYYSEVAHYVPCELCWYQRIAMYPLAVVLGVATFLKDRDIRRYVIPIVVTGGAIAMYHYLLQRVPDLSGASCDPTAPCTVTWVWELHYISIPFMALSAFALAATVLLAMPRESDPTRKEKEHAGNTHS